MDTFGYGIKSSQCKTNDKTMYAGIGLNQICLLTMAKNQWQPHRGGLLLRFLPLAMFWCDGPIHCNIVNINQIYIVGPLQLHDSLPCFNNTIFCSFNRIQIEYSKYMPVWRVLENLFIFNH